MELSEFGIDAWTYNYYVSIYIKSRSGSDLEFLAQSTFVLLRSRGTVLWYGEGPTDAFYEAAIRYSDDASESATRMFGGGDIRRAERSGLTRFERILFKVRLTNGTE